VGIFDTLGKEPADVYAKATGSTTSAKEPGKRERENGLLSSIIFNLGSLLLHQDIFMVVY
jgi:hypothetical protein